MENILAVAKKFILNSNQKSVLPLLPLQGLGQEPASTDKK